MIGDNELVDDNNDDIFLLKIWRLIQRGGRNVAGVLWPPPGLPQRDDV